VNLNVEYCNIWAVLWEWQEGMVKDAPPQEQLVLGLLYVPINVLNAKDFMMSRNARLFVPLIAVSPIPTM
jgi:hypothetical protein